MVPTKAILQFVEGHTFVAKADSNHYVTIDTAATSGGHGAANDPVQLLVCACGGCVCIDVVDILAKKRKPVARFTMEVEAVRYPEPPKIIRALHFHAILEGESLETESVQRAMNLSLTKYCSVTLSLDRTVRIRASARINGLEIPEWQVARDPAIYERPEVEADPES